MGNKLLTTTEAAALLQVSSMPIRRYCDAGLISCIRVGASAHRRIPLSEVERILGQDIVTNDSYDPRKDPKAVHISIDDLEVDEPPTQMSNEKQLVLRNLFALE